MSSVQPPIAPETQPSAADGRSRLKFRPHRRPSWFGRPDAEVAGVVDVGVPGRDRVGDRRLGRGPVARGRGPVLIPVRWMHASSTPVRCYGNDAGRPGIGDAAHEPEQDRPERSTRDPGHICHVGSQRAGADRSDDGWVRGARVATEMYSTSRSAALVDDDPDQPGVGPGRLGVAEGARWLLPRWQARP